MTGDRGAEPPNRNPVVRVLRRGEQIEKLGRSPNMGESRRFDMFCSCNQSKELRRSVSLVTELLASTAHRGSPAFIESFGALLSWSSIDLRKETRKMMKIAGMMMLLIGVSGAAFAGIAPEISPSAAGSAVALISGAVLVIRGRRRK